MADHQPAGRARRAVAVVQPALPPDLAVLLRHQRQHPGAAARLRPARASSSRAPSIAGLLAGPGPDLRRVARSYLPDGLSIDLSVPISADRARRHHAGRRGRAAQTPAVIDRMLAQLAWTLRQEPDITSLRVTIGDEVVQVPGGGTEYPVAEAIAYDPSGDGASPDIYGLRGRRALAPRRQRADARRRTPRRGRRRRRPLGCGRPRRHARPRRSRPTARGVLVAPMSDRCQPVTPSCGAGRSPTAPTCSRRPGTSRTGCGWSTGRQRVPSCATCVDGVGAPAGGAGRERSHGPVVPRLARRHPVRGRGAQRSRGRRARRAGSSTTSADGPSAVSATVLAARRPGRAVRIVDLTWTSPTAVALLIPVIPREFFEVRTRQRRRGADQRRTASPPPSRAVSSAWAARRSPTSRPTA